jgi:hypothetical protein
MLFAAPTKGVHKRQKEMIARAIQSWGKINVPTGRRRVTGKERVQRKGEN